MRLALCVFFLASSLLSNEVEDPEPLAEGNPLGVLEGEPSAIVQGCVNALTGDFVDFQADIIVPGAGDLSLKRFYSTSQTNPESPWRAWHFNHDISLHTQEGARHTYPVLRGAFGSRLRFKGHIKNFLLDEAILEKGVTNTSSREISGKTNLKNKSIHLTKSRRYYLKDGEGCRTFFFGGPDVEYTYAKEVLRPNGNRLKYTYHHGALEAITSLNRKDKLFGKISIVETKTEDEATLEVFGQGQQKAVYKMRKMKHILINKKWLIDSVNRTLLPEESYEYGPFGKITKKSLPNRHYLEIDYYTFFPIKKRYSHLPKGALPGRIRSLKAPLGADETPITLCNFEYFPTDRNKTSYKEHEYVEGYTRVYDPYHHLTEYAYTWDERLDCVTKYTGTSDHTPYSKEHFVWEYDGNLMRRYVLGPNNTPVFCRSYTYDAAGNVIEECLYGTLTGKRTLAKFDSYGWPEENTENLRLMRKYADDDFHSLIFENHPSHPHNYRYQYHPGTSLLAARFTVSNEVIKIREFFEYDESGAVTLEIRDDGSSSKPHNLSGVTQRTLVRTQNTQTFPLGLPEIIEEKYVDLSTGEEVLLKKKVHRYDDAGRVAETSIFDAEGNLAYTLSWKYNAQGKVIEETDALGRMTLRSYDDNGNKIQEISPSGVRTTYTYDFMNRLTREDENGILSKSYRYDYNGNKISTTDIYGQETLYEYDEFNREVKVISPLNTITQKEYDVLGNVTALIDPSSHKTSAEYTIYGKPYYIAYPDGTQERFIYSRKGALMEKIHKNGSYILYEYDYLTRPTQEMYYSKDHELLSTTRRRYDPFNLLEETDNGGHKTHFTYDGAGRLISKEREGSLIQYRYDTLGRIVEEKGPYYSLRKEYDLLDRVIREWTEDSEGSVFDITTTVYDEEGRVVEISSHENKKKFVYNFHGDPITEIDALGNTTHICYNYPCENRVDRIDPLGRCYRVTRDALDRIVSEEHLNSFGTLIKAVDHSYDPSGNRTRTTEGGKTTLWEYDSMRRPKASVEAAGTEIQKRIEISYTKSGRVKKRMQPDGTFVAYTYDAKDRLQVCTASDQSLHFSFEYDLLDNWVRSHDRILQQTTERAYDRRNHLTKETLGNGLSTDYTYDLAGRLSQLTLPDGSGVEYIYRGPCLAQVLRLSDTKEVKYSHTYESYNSNRRPLKETSIGQAVTLNFSYDLLDRLTRQQSNFMEETLTYDLVGNVDTRALGPHKYTYRYTDLDQLCDEEGPISHSYAYDSLNTLISKDAHSYTTNLLNQLIEDPKHTFAYGLRGNRIAKNDTQYDYDAENQLICIMDTNQKASYTYDALGRRLSKTLYCRKNGEWELSSQILFLYQEDQEIGAFDSDKKPLELKILGLQDRKDSDIGSAIALEISGRLYVPCHDAFGNIIALLDLEENALIDEMAFSSFGEATATSRINPWRYASKRHDAESGLILFGQRYYDPASCRWLTPDPLDFDDGMNLYAFSHNNPLRYYDPDGRFAVALLIPLFTWGTELAIALPTVAELTYLTCAAVATGAAYYGGYKLGEYYGANTNQPNIISSPALLPNTGIYRGPAGGFYDATGMPITLNQENQESENASNTNPYIGPVSDDVMLVDPAGNIIPVKKGEKVTGSKDGSFLQVRDKDNKYTGYRKDGPHTPIGNDDPRHLKPHGHVPGVYNPDGTPWLSIYH